MTQVETQKKKSPRCNSRGPAPKDPARDGAPTVHVPDLIELAMEIDQAQARIDEALAACRRVAMRHHSPGRG